MELRRTVPVKLAIEAEQAALLHETIEQFRWAANHVVDLARQDDGYVLTQSGKLHERTYETVRDNTDLHANHVQAARRRACEALKSTIAKWKQRRIASLPTFTSPFLEYDKRSATFHEEYASLSTVDGRIEAVYILPSKTENTPHEAYLESEEYEITGATLHYREHSDEWYLHLRTRAELDDVEPRENGTVLGVDLGVENIAVTSTGMFWSGSKLDHWRREYEKRRAALQRCGSRDAHEAMQSIGRTETGRFTILLHEIVNGIVEEAAARGCSHIAFEELTDIRDRMAGAKRLHSWAFRHLYKFVEYKAVERGVRVEQVDPAKTSQRCLTCGHTDRGNRPTQDRFCCQQCGYENHADYNAAKNIAYDLLRHQNGAEGGAPVGVRLNGGTMTASGEVTASPALG